MEALIGMGGVALGVLLGAWVTEFHDARGRRRDSLEALDLLLGDLFQLSQAIGGVAEYDVIPDWSNRAIDLGRIHQRLDDARPLLTRVEAEVANATMISMEVMVAVWPQWKPSERDVWRVNRLEGILAERLRLERRRSRIALWRRWTDREAHEKQLRDLADFALNIVAGDSGSPTAGPQEPSATPQS